MPSFRSLTTRIKTAISPSSSSSSSSTTSSPSTSPVSSQSSNTGFQNFGGRKQSSFTQQGAQPGSFGAQQSSFGVVARSDSYPRLDSMTTVDSSSASERGDDKGDVVRQRRLSRFREELQWEGA